MTTKKIYIFLSLLFLTYFSFGQTVPKYIFFYKPYTDSSETNLYKDTLVKFDYNIQYANIANANINDDIENAIKNNDFRLISISGNSYLFPGLEGGYKKLKDGTKAFVPLGEKYEAHFKKYGFKVIEGTSDFIDGNKLPLQSIAYDYAKKYNRLLLQKLARQKINSGTF
jgi:hypothetical protein